jgi:hypothetical protein
MKKQTKHKLPMTDSNLSREEIADWQKFFASDGKDSGDCLAAGDYKTKVVEKATADFLDVISEYSCDLESVEIYQCFLRATVENKNYELKDYLKAMDLANIAATVRYETQRPA